MATVSIEQDAKYRRDGDRYVEVCRACNKDRSGDTCECGATFERMTRSFFALEWKPTSLQLRMPDVCPHCEGRATKMRSVTIRLPTTRREMTRMTVDVPSCAKMLHPYLAWLLVLIAVFWFVVFALAAAFGNGVPAIAGALVTAAAVVAAWRAYGWFRFRSFDHRSLRFRARRPGYAARLAELNGGRVL